MEENGTETGVEKTIRTLRQAAEVLPPLEEVDAFGAFFDRYGGAKVVLLGEASHGTSEFYKARAAITRRLIERHGFNIVAVEADWPDARRIDRYVRHHAPGMSEDEAFARFPTWMWKNQEVHDFVHWLRDYNKEQPDHERTEFRGLDIYSLRSSIAAVLEYLDIVDPEEAQRARKCYSCLTPWQDKPAEYGRAMLGTRTTCEEGVVAQLKSMLDHRVEYARIYDGEHSLNAVQNARIVRGAEQYYRAMFYGGSDSWNLRDRHMFTTLQLLMKARGPTAKAVVWAHNSHIGDASATEMGEMGEFNIGELCRTAYGPEAVLIGFGTDRGTVAAADNWDHPMHIKNVLPSRKDSYEWLFLRAGHACSLTDLRDQPSGRLAGSDDRISVREELMTPRLERAIGVVYRPKTERQSHYFMAVLPEQFDAYVWFEETAAVTPLGKERPQNVPDTYPFGV